MVKTIGKKEITESIQFTPTTAPTPSKGKLYYDSSTNKLKVCEDGSNFKDISDVSSADFSAINLEIAGQAIEIIELQANATIDPFDHDTLISETFSVAGGYNNYVNVGNTTAHFSTNKYQKNLSLDNPKDTDATEYSTGSTSWVLMKTFDLSGNPYKIYKVGCQAKSDSTPPGYFKFVVTYADDSTETLEQQIHTNSYNVYLWQYDYPSDLTQNVKKVEVYLKRGQGTQYIKDLSLWEYDTNPQIVEINLPTITGTITYTQLVANTPDRESGDDVKYDLYDTVGNHDDDLDINTKNPLTNCDGTKISGGKIKIKLIPKPTNPTEGYPSIKSFCLKLWKS